MRIYRTKRIRREWTDADRSLARHMHSEGFCANEIAAALGRQPPAVRAWLHHNCRIWREPEVIICYREIVRHDDVPEWYALGWRYVGPVDGGYIFEWTSSGLARMPNSAPPSPNDLELAA